ncbi:MAG: 5'/3'-nucleotidase SurE [Planctomycetes bacterium]|nr:5'/3'-nucleotidase SurE [Planctomycetota bacterium]
MRILLTNDDGLHATGISAMYDTLAGADGAVGGPLPDPPDAVLRSPRSVVFPVAPLTVQSAAGHGITLHEPLFVKEDALRNGVRGFAVDGRPADCVKLALRELWPQRYGGGTLPDLVVSGINHGANCGISVLYSGTVAAALEAAFLGVPSIAVSLLLRKSAPRFDVAARWAREVIEMCLAGGMLRPHECLSINLPICEEERPLPRVVVCPMNTHRLIDEYDRRESPAGEVYYWPSKLGLEFHATDKGTDVEELFNGAVTVTPLAFDLTHYGTLERWSKRLARDQGAKP